MSQELRMRVLSIAVSQIGVKEIPGEAANPRIIEYDQCTSLKATSDETPWCSAFANWVMKQAGIKGTNSAAARSWLAWGVGIDEPAPGCIVVFKRGAPPSGHVAFFIEKVQEGFLKVLGGNQSDQVKISTFKEADVLGYRWVDNDKEATT